MDKNFENQYFEFDSHDDHWWLKVRRLIIKDLLRAHFPSQNPKILDFGSSSGEFVQYLQKLGYDTVGCDVSEEAIKKGEQKGISNLTVLKNDRLDFSSESFDVVLALDVLEHVKDEAKAIKEIHRVLKKGGLFIVFVPAFPFLWGFQDEISYHYRRYTLPSLLRIINQSADFAIVRKSYFNTLLFPPIALVRLVHRIIKPKNQKSDLEINNNLLNNLFFRIFNFERKLLRRLSFPFGVSVLLVSRKK
ncbi:class I SAM-dependent methyltransferase [Candidatus Parcubacteria bacterium]|nr:class I SAM-dependent methyltransferase [Candidatus Parcubacteria bacterium]